MKQTFSSCSLQLTLSLPPLQSNWLQANILLLLLLFPVAWKKDCDLWLPLCPFSQTICDTFQPADKSFLKIQTLIYFRQCHKRSGVSVEQSQRLEHGSSQQDTTHHPHSVPLWYSFNGLISLTVMGTLERLICIIANYIVNCTIACVRHKS